MAGLLLSRIGYGVAVLFAATSLVFGMIHLSGDPLAALVPPGSSPEQEARLREHFGLDRSIPAQYVTFIGHAVRGDFGDSWRADRPALTLVVERLGATLRLTAVAIALALGVGVPLGIVAAARRGSTLDALATGVALLGQAVPGFWLGTLLILIFAVRLGWLPSSGGDGTASLILPAITLAAFPAATFARLLRASLIETMARDFIRTARGKGLSSRTVLSRHALRNATLPLLGYVGFQAGFLLGGAVVVEGVFAFPGIGQLALQSVAARDLPVIQAFVVVVAALIVVLTIAVDLVAGLIDPRQRGDAGAALGAA